MSVRKFEPVLYYIICNYWWSETAFIQNEVDEVIRELKLIPGFSSYLILNNDGIVIKYENMSYKEALHHSHQVLGLTGKAAKYIRELFEANENEVSALSDLSISTH